MTFEGQYLTYAEYQALGGSAIGDMPFNLLEFEARRQIDNKTQNRLVNETNIPQEVKLCMYKLINTITTYTNNHNKNISSEHVGEYSISYNNDIKEIIQNKNDELNDIIITDLYGLVINNEHILYVGV
jgi:hypothetical protein